MPTVSKFEEPMKTTILYIDDHSGEAANLINTVAAELCLIAPAVVVISANDGPDELPGQNSILSFKTCTPSEVPLRDSHAEIGVLAQSYDFFMLDICWSSDNAEDDDGLKYAVCLRAAGVAESRILLVTNKAFDATLRKTRLKTLPGADNVNYPAASKGRPAKIAEELHARTSLSPKRSKIAITDAINSELYSGKGLDAFFHLTGCTRQEAIQSCDALKQIADGLPEVAWLLHSVGTFLQTNSDEPAKSYLENYLPPGVYQNAMVGSRRIKTFRRYWLLPAR